MSTPLKGDQVKMEPNSSPSSSTSVRVDDLWMSEADEFTSYFMSDVDGHQTSGTYFVKFGGPTLYDQIFIIINSSLCT